MSSKLLLLRHAKSSWSLDGLADSDRPLNGRGQEASRAMGNYIANHDLLPDVIISSPAVRARETVAGLDKQWSGSVPVFFEPAIYGAAACELLYCIQAQAEGAQKILVVGHNPGIENLALFLDPNGPEKLVREITRKFPTCGLAVFSCNEPWSQLSARNAFLDNFVRPKDLESGG